MTYLEAIEDALERFPDMPVEMRQAFYTVLLVGDVTEEEAAANLAMYSDVCRRYPDASLLLPTLQINDKHASLYNNWLDLYIERLKRTKNHTQY